MWQVLADELDGFTVCSVALDANRESAAKLIRRYEPRYPVLIDERHTVAELYGMVNVPSAVWIDEDGAVVRPTHTAGAGEAWRQMDRETRKVPDEARAEQLATRLAYMDAVRAWVRDGAHELREPPPDPGEGLALAHFRLATYLHERGLDGAHRHFEEAVRLRPASWNFRRQALALERPEDAAEQYWAAVDATAPGAYYPPPEGI